MYVAYALNKNKITNDMLAKGLRVFNGCYLDGSFQFRNMDYDLFAMYEDDIKYIETHYKNGQKMLIKVYFNNNKDDFMVGALYYWYNDNIGNRGLIATHENSWAEHLFEERSEII